MPFSNAEPVEPPDADRDANTRQLTHNRRRGLFARFITPRGDEAVDPLGVPVRFHYWLLAIFAVGVAAGPLGFSFAPGGEELRNPLTRALCIGGLLLAPTIVIVGRRTGYVFKDWIFQGTLFFALLGTFLSNLVTPQMIAPFMTLYILTPMGGAFYLPARKMIPLAVTSAAAILYMSTRVDEPNAMLRGIILAIVAVFAADLAAELKSKLTHAVEINREISEHDPLTGAHNLHRFERRLSEEIARAERGGEGFVLAMFDLDNFKQVNDSFNHSTGDEVLVAAAEAIGSALLPSDLLVRRGGDEFASIIPVSEARDPQATVDLARKRIERARREICPALTPYASAGWVTYKPPETAKQLLERADGALHEAKALAPERRGHRSQRTTSLVAGARPRSADVADLPRLLNEVDVIRDDPISELVAASWRVSARVVVATCIAVTTMVLAGATTFKFPIAGILVLAGWVVILIPVVVWATARRHEPPYAKHLVAVAALALISAGCAVLGDAAPTVVDVYMFTAVLFVALLPYKRAAIYLTLSMGLYGFFLFANDYPYAEIRLTVASMNVFLTSILLTVTRYNTILAAREKAQLARTDALTALPNTRRMRDRIGDEIRRCEVTGDQFALLMLDLDDFKPVNDLHSHSLGDKVLVAVAEAISSVSRGADMPARRGGDEFAVVMTDAGEHAATLAAERVANAIQATRASMVPSINPNASVGWAVWQPGDSGDDLIARADAALHEKKTQSYRSRLRYADAS